MEAAQHVPYSPLANPWKERALALEALPYTDRLGIALHTLHLLPPHFDPYGTLFHKDWCEQLDQKTAPWINHPDAQLFFEKRLNQVVRTYVKARRRKRPPLSCRTLCELDPTCSEIIVHVWQQVSRRLLPNTILPYTERQFPLDLFSDLRTCVALLRCGITVEGVPTDPEKLCQLHIKHLGQRRLHAIGLVDWYLRDKLQLIKNAVMKLALMTLDRPTEWTRKEYEILKAHGLVNASAMRATFNPFIDGAIRMWKVQFILLRRKTRPLMGGM